MSIFGKNATELGGVFFGDEASLTIGSADGKNGEQVSLIQNFQIQYQLQFQPVYEFGSKAIWFSKTPGAGTLTINRIVGGKNIIDTFKTNECKGLTLKIGLNQNTECDTPVGTRNITLTNTFLTGVQFSGQAGQAYVIEGLTATFVDIDVTGGQGGQGGQEGNQA